MKLGLELRYYDYLKNLNYSALVTSCIQRIFFHWCLSVPNLRPNKTKARVLGFFSLVFHCYVPDRPESNPVDTFSLERMFFHVSQFKI